MGILSGIANPALAKPFSSFEEGAQIGREQKTRSREEETRRLAGLILTQTTGATVGGLAKKLIESDPNAALDLFKALNIPVGENDRLAHTIGNVRLGSLAFRIAGTKGLAQFAAGQAALFEGIGIQPNQYLEVIQGATSPDPAVAQQTGENIEQLDQMLVDRGFLPGPKVDKEPPALRTLKGRATAAGFKPGTPKFREFMLHGGPAPKTGRAADQRDRKISDYMRLFDKTKQEAIRAVDSQTMIDDRGNLITFDPISGEGKLVDVDTGVEAPVITPPKGVTIEDLSVDPSEGTGFGAAFVGLWNSTLGQLPFLPIGKDAEIAAQTLRVLERDAILALASSGRPPIVEQERIIKLIPEAMDWFQNPEVAKFKMTNFIDLMINQYIDDLRYSQNRRNPKKVRDESAGRSRRIESIIRRVLTPVAAQAMFDSLNKMEAEIGQIRDMSDKELNTLDPATLSDSQLDAYIDRLRLE